MTSSRPAELVIPFFHYLELGALKSSVTTDWKFIILVVKNCIKVYTEILKFFVVLVWRTMNAD